jgi:hypothetical protein
VEVVYSSTTPSTQTTCTRSRSKRKLKSSRWKWPIATPRCPLKLLTTGITFQNTWTTLRQLNL